MGLLDKIRSQPRWKHADPAVRLEGLADLDEGAQDILGGLASDDPDARVRRAAATRLVAPETLEALARNDVDQSVRDAAIDRLAALALRGAAATALAAVRALVALGRERELAGVARSPAPEPVRRAALTAVADARLLAGVAQHAADAGTRLLALERIADQEQVAAVALRAEHGDTAVAAVERLIEPADALLAELAQRARTRAAAKKARALLRAREVAARPATQAAAVEYRDTEQQQAREIATRLEGLAAVADLARVREEYAAVRAAWVELLADAEILPALVDEVERRSETIRQRLAADEAARAEAARRAAAERLEQADRIAICERLEALDGDDLPERLAEARAAWEALPPMPETWAAALERRFADACRAAEQRHARRRRAAALAERLPQIVPEIEQLAAAEPYAAVRAQWLGLRRQWEAIRRHVQVDEALTARVEAAAAALEAREQAARAERARQQAQNLVRLREQVQQLENRAASEQLTLKEATELVKEARRLAGSMGPLPTRQDREDLAVRLQAVRTALVPRIQELREAEEWKRWANVQVQEELIAKMEALIPAAAANPAEAAPQMRQLQERWKTVASAPRGQGEALWTRFKAARDQVYEHCKDYFAQQAAERAENLKKKEALVARAEALADSTDWIRTAEAIKQLQVEWKAIGPATRGHEKAVWERFRAACDRFFTRRQADLKQRKAGWAANLARKEALCAEVEQLVDSTEWEATAQRIRQIQAEWKTIGPVKKNKSEAIWQRFRAACDAFYERYKTRDVAALASRLGDREAVVAEIEALAATAAGEGAPGDLYAKVQAARARWAQGPDLPRHVTAPLAERYNAALYALVVRWPDAFAGTELDPASTLRKMEKLCAKVEALVPAHAAEVAERLSPAELLAQQWREALAANTMGIGAARQAEEARQRAAEQEVRSAQAAWQRLGPVDPAARKPLQERFDRAVRRFFEHKRRHTPLAMRG